MTVIFGDGDESVEVFIYPVAVSISSEPSVRHLKVIGSRKDLTNLIFTVRQMT